MKRDRPLFTEWGIFTLSADLHCHTNLSDGSLGIEELINLAVKNNVDTIAITDQDCLAGTVRGRILGERNGIKVIPGAELSSIDSETGAQVHILAYCCEYPDRIEGLCHYNSAARKKAGQYMMLKCAQKYPVSAELVLKCAQGSTNLYKQHIMLALMHSGCTNEIYGELYEKLFNKDSEDNILVTPKFADTQKVIRAVLDAGGIPVLAHPMLYGNTAIIDRLISYGLAGIEVWHPTCSEEDENRLMDIARKNKLLMTGGSDFHGMYNRGCRTLGDHVTPQAHLSELLNYKTKMKRLQKKMAAVKQAAE